jgi:lysozyme
VKPAGKSWVVGGFTALAIALASALTSHYEGVRYTAYQDTGGVWTICYGHTYGVRQGDTATPAQCRAWLDADMPVAYAAVNRCITAALTVTQAAAFTDAAFNLGPKVVCGSTLQRLANNGHVVEACHQLPRWSWAAGKKLRGLALRRDDETDLCTQGLT